MQTPINRSIIQKINMACVLNDRFNPVPGSLSPWPAEEHRWVRDDLR